jgi:hypothetical protein
VLGNEVHAPAFGKSSLNAGVVLHGSSKAEQAIPVEECDSGR